MGTTRKVFFIIVMAASALFAGCTKGDYDVPYAIEYIIEHDFSNVSFLNENHVQYVDEYTYNGEDVFLFGTSMHWSDVWGPGLLLLDADGYTLGRAVQNGQTGHWVYTTGMEDFFSASTFKRHIWTEEDGWII